MISITFKPLEFSDIPTIHQWFNKPHVQAFYSLKHWTEQEVFAKLKPYILSEKPVKGFIIVMNQQPIGYIQYYKVKDYAEHAAGMDLFIGEEPFVGKGLGSKTIKEFLDVIIWPQFQYCIVDPDVRNTAAIRCYEKLNFKEHAVIESENALGHATQLKLMICGNTPSYLHLCP